MLSDYKKNKKGGVAKSWAMRFWGMVVLLLVAVLVIADIHMYKKRQEFTAQTAALARQIQDLKDQNTALNQDIANADNDQYIERVAREQLDLQKQGEHVVSFIMPATQSSKANTANQNVLQNWWKWISKHI